MLARALDNRADPRERLAAAAVAIRSCFFSTTYEGALLAAETARRVRDAGNSAPDPELLGSWSAERGHDSAAMELDPTLLERPADCRAFYWKAIAVVYGLVGDNERALEAFGRALSEPVSAVLHAQLRMFRALVLAKRMRRLSEGTSELEQGLQAVAGIESPAALREEGWLRNVLGLVHFSQRELEPALQEEKKALRCVAGLADASSIHLKINLVSNLSVLQETAGLHQAALETWERFSRTQQVWDANFAKHHRYRTAGLWLRLGDEAQAVAGFRSVYSVAGELGDEYHRHVVASELGGFFLNANEPAEAAIWFTAAREHAHEVGDPLAVAKALAGEALACDRRPPPQAALLAAASSTYEAAGRELIELLDADDRGGLRQLLPLPKTKLNRPFDLVNL
jgi:tetratricopeptide (TPR) repeat protein